MKAMVIRDQNKGGKLSLEHVSLPTLGSRDLLIKVKAASINRADLFQLRGEYPSASKTTGPIVAGIEAAGEVVDAGVKVSGFKTGDRVTGICTGGYAQFTTMDYQLAIPVPENLDWQEAAGFPLGYMTEYNALITNAGLKEGESVMITAASSGVGLAGIQLSRFFKAVPIIGTSGSPRKFARLKSLGVDRVIDYRNENISKTVRQATNDYGIDVILDHIGEDLDNQIKSLAIKGRLISIGRLGKSIGKLDMELLALNRLQIIGVTFRTRTLDEKITIVQKVISDLLPALADGRLRPVLDRIFPLEKAKEAIDYMKSNTQFGKITLKME